jgi:hypothetical protein
MSPVCQLEMTPPLSSELTLRTALTRLWYRQRSSSKQRLDFAVNLFDHPVDILVAQLA